MNHFQTLLVLSYIDLYYFQVYLHVPNILSSEHIWHISIANKELGTHDHLKGMNELRLCVKKVTPIECPSKPKEHKTVDIMVFLFINQQFFDY